MSDDWPQGWYQNEKPPAGEPTRDAPIQAAPGAVGSTGFGNGGYGNRGYGNGGTAGGWPTQLTISDQRQTQPVWSPDGTWIAYASDHDGDEQWNLFLVSPKTGQGSKAGRISISAPSITTLPQVGNRKLKWARNHSSSKGKPSWRRSSKTWDKSSHRYQGKRNWSCRRVPQ